MYINAKHIKTLKKNSEVKWTDHVNHKYEDLFR